MSEILLILMIFVFIGWPWVRIVWKAGYSPWLGLLVFVPIANILFFSSVPTLIFESCP